MSSTRRRQSLVAVYKIKKKVFNYSSFFKASLKMVTLLKENNRGLQMQSVALLKEIQAHKFAPATSRHNKTRLLDTLNALKTHVDMAAVMSSDLKAHVDMMIDQVSPDDDTPEESSDCSRQPVNNTAGVYDIQVESGKRQGQFPRRPDIPTTDLPQTRTENASTKSSDLHGGPTNSADLGSKPWGVELQAGRRKVLRSNSNSIRVTDMRKSQVLPQPALDLGSKPWGVELQAGRRKVLTDHRGAGGDCELLTPAKAPCAVTYRSCWAPKKNYSVVMTVLPSLNSAPVIDPPSSSMAVAAADQEDNRTSTEEVQPSGMPRCVASRIPKLKKHHACDLNSDKKCSSRAKESSKRVMQRKPISTLLQKCKICNRTEEVQPSGMPPRRVASRIPKLRRHHACDLNLYKKFTSRPKKTSKSEIPEDFQRFNTR